MTDLDREEQEILDSYEAGEWESAHLTDEERGRYQDAASATLKRDREVQIHLSSPDFQALQKRALAEGVPYQTLITSILHKFLQGRLEEGR